MRLIRRPQMTTLALPRSKTWPSDAVPNHRTPWEFTPDAFTFAHFMLGSPGYIEETLQGNLAELRLEVETLIKWSGVKKKDATDEELGIEYAKIAIKKVEEQIVKAGELKTSFVMTGRKQALRELKEIEEQVGKEELNLRLPVIETSSSEIEDLPIEFLAIRNSGEGRPIELSSEAPSFLPSNQTANVPNKPRPRRNVNPPPPADTTFFFYQAASGQNIFLDGLDIKLLKSHFGSYSLFPETIEVEILGREEGTMNEDLSKRCRYLSHLSTGSDIIFIEANLTKLVDHKTLETFSTALKFRKNKRRDKVRREDKAKTISEQREVENRPQFMQGLSTSSSSYVFSHANRQEANPYTSMPYAGFLESANFPSSLPRASPPDSDSAVAPVSGKKTVWGTNSFNTALHASSRVQESYAEDDGWDEWALFEESNGRRGGGNGRASGSAGGSNSGGGVEAVAAAGGKKKKNKKLVLNLSGGGGRGTS